MKTVLRKMKRRRIKITEKGKDCCCQLFTFNLSTCICKTKTSDKNNFHVNSKYHFIVNYFRLLTVDVNNVLTQLRLKEVHVDNTSKVAVETSRVVEEYDPDCFVLVYAVDDKDSFGEFHAVLSFESQVKK